MLKVTDLQVSYGKVQVLHGISLGVEKGSIVSIVGANGSGKSTLINTISGLVKASAGQIVFEGAGLAHIPAHAVARKGIVQIPEGRKLFPQMTVYENLTVGGISFSSPKERPLMLEEMYKDFPLLKLRAKQLASTLSGGEQQILAIARGLMSKPKLLMLDEPSLGLAPMVVREIFRIIKSLNRGGLTVLLVEQNIEQSLKLCDYGYVLQNGRIVLQGNSGDLLGNEFMKKAYLGM